MSDDVYPDGLAWRCSRCDFATDDDGPDYCPVDGAALTRVLAVLKLGASPEVPDVT